MTLPEALLWRALRRDELGRRVRRQHPLGPYVLDFYCDAAKLAIEVDGELHAFGRAARHDAERDAWLAERGVRTLRLPARYVLRSLHDAVETIRAALDPPP